MCWCCREHSELEHPFVSERFDEGAYGVGRVYDRRWFEIAHEAAEVRRAEK